MEEAALGDTIPRGAAVEGPGAPSAREDAGERCQHWPIPPTPAPDKRADHGATGHTSTSEPARRTTEKNGPRALALALAERAGWPATPIRPWMTVVPSRAGWTTFVRAAPDADVAAALRGLALDLGLLGVEGVEHDFVFVGVQSGDDEDDGDDRGDAA